MSCIVDDRPVIKCDGIQIEPGKVVRLRFWAREQASRETLQFGDDLCYLHGSDHGMFPHVVESLSGLSQGGKTEVVLTPEQGYGSHDPQRVIVQPRHSIPEEAQVQGYTLMGELPDGNEVPFTVLAVNDEHVTLDGNHPWAGKTLHFTFEVLEVRDSTDAERAAGYPLD